MVKLIQKSGYIATGKGGGYMKYIATRKGVEKLTGKEKIIVYLRSGVQIEQEICE